MREIRIRDTLSGELRSLDGAGEIGIYACGPTVYSRIHIGNARPFVVFSLFARFLRSEGYRPKLVVNVTDINDKIYVAARAAGKPSGEFAEEMKEAYFADTDRLGLGRPDAEPLATETVAGIVSLIQELVDSGHAYESGGDVYFRVRSFGPYGKLSNRRPEDMDQGEDAGSASLKEERLDFALWKAHKPDEDTSWDSPWGPRRVPDLRALPAAACFWRGADGGIHRSGRAGSELLSGQRPGGTGGGVRRTKWGGSGGPLPRCPCRSGGSARSVPRCACR